MQKILASENGRLDVILSKVLQISRSQVAQFIKSGAVCVNSKPQKKPSFLVNLGDEITFLRQIPLNLMPEFTANLSLNSNLNSKPKFTTNSNLTHEISSSNSSNLSPDFSNSNLNLNSKPEFSNSNSLNLASNLAQNAISPLSRDKNSANLNEKSVNLTPNSSENLENLNANFTNLSPKFSNSNSTLNLNLNLKPEFSSENSNFNLVQNTVSPSLLGENLANLSPNLNENPQNSSENSSLNLTQNAVSPSSQSENPVNLNPNLNENPQNFSKNSTNLSQNLNENPANLTQNLNENPINLTQNHGDFQRNFIPKYPINFDVAVLYEDEDVLVLNKPPNVICHGANSVREATLVDWLFARGYALSSLGGAARAGLVHRLDKGTSGALIVAKHNAAHAALAKQLSTRTLGRFYLALTDLPLKEDKMLVELSLVRSSSNRLKKKAVQSASGARFAKSAFVNLLRGGEQSAENSRFGVNLASKNMENSNSRVNLANKNAENLHFRVNLDNQSTENLNLRVNLASKNGEFSANLSEKLRQKPIATREFLGENAKFTPNLSDKFTKNSEFSQNHSDKFEAKFSDKFNQSGEFNANSSDKFNANQNGEFTANFSDKFNRSREFNANQNGEFTANSSDKFTKNSDFHANLSKNFSQNNEFSANSADIGKKKGVKLGRSVNLIAAKLFTGRTHQIRAHLESLNRHILGDTLYGYKGRECGRVMLHAYFLHFLQPRTGEQIFVRAPLFSDFAALLESNFNKGEIDEKLELDYIKQLF